MGSGNNLLGTLRGLPLSSHVSLLASGLIPYSLTTMRQAVPEGWMKEPSLHWSTSLPSGINGLKDTGMQVSSCTGLHFCFHVGGTRPGLSPHPACAAGSALPSVFTQGSRIGGGGQEAWWGSHELHLLQLSLISNKTDSVISDSFIYFLKLVLSSDVPNEHFCAPCFQFRKSCFIHLVRWNKIAMWFVIYSSVEAHRPFLIACPSRSHLLFKI